MEGLDYISTGQVQTMHFTSQAGARRSSLFNRHLQAMQNAAKKQEEMYNMFLGQKNGKKEGGEGEGMDEEHPITID